MTDESKAAAIDAAEKYLALSEAQKAFFEGYVASEEIANKPRRGRPIGSKNKPPAEEQVTSWPAPRD